MGLLTQTVSNSKYNSHTLSMLLEAVEESRCQWAGRAVALTVQKNQSPRPELCKGQLDRVHQLLEGQSHASPLLLWPISHTMGSLLQERRTAANIYREDTATTLSLILSNSLSSQNHSAGAKGIHSEQQANLRTIKNKNMHKYTKHTLKYPTFISFMKIC